MDLKELNYLSKDELIGIITDLTKKYSLENKEILPINVDYRSLLEATSDIIFVIDKNENLVYINSKWKTLFPSMDKEPAGSHYTKYLPDIEKERAAYVFNSVIKDGTVFENEMMKTYDENGRPWYFLASFSPIKSDDGSNKGLIGIMKNITERHQIEKKLKENSKILEEKVKELVKQSDEIRGLREFSDDIINNAPIGIFMMDPSGIMLSENPSLKIIMGHGDESRIGVNLLNYSGFANAGLDRAFVQVLNEKKSVKVNNAPYVPIVGDRELIIDVIMTPIFEGPNTVGKVLVMVEDNTEQARSTLRAQRAERLSSLGFLASGVASELTGYINKMAMDLNFVRNNINDSNPAVEYVDSLKDEVDRIKNISEQLLSLSITEEVDKDMCDVNKAVKGHSIEVMTNRLQKEGFVVDVKLSPDNPMVKATPNQLQQIVLQFLENAEEAMPDKGKVGITVETLKVSDGTFALITVSDDGIGIPEDNIKRVFQPFFTTKGKNATGLGLMIVSTIVENLGGTIGVRSAPGKGTQIKIALPAITQ